MTAMLDRRRLVRKGPAPARVSTDHFLAWSICIIVGSTYLAAFRFRVYENHDGLWVFKDTLDDFAAYEFFRWSPQGELFAGYYLWLGSMILLASAPGFRRAWKVFREARGW